MPLIGLTGGLASGKSAVAAMFRERGAVIIDCDELAREVTARGQRGHDLVTGAFGSGVVGPDGELDRAALAGVVFTDPARRRELESLLHPLILERVRAVARAAFDADPGAVALVEAVKLFEAGWDREMDANILVVAGPGQQRARALQRGGLDVEQVERRLAAQTPPEQGPARADFVIDNSQTPEHTRAQVARVWAALTGGKK
ncbi:MAG: dephospho-CoA kinase [Nitrospinae bacterium]|nr:dephospho-CoA kinase [Nitrospinota bacterium]